MEIENPLEEKVYRIQLKLEALNPVLQTQARMRNASLLEFSLKANAREIRVLGKTTRTGRLRGASFEVIFRPDHVEHHGIYFKCQRFRFRTYPFKTFDLYRFLSPFPFAQRIAMNRFTRKMPPAFEQHGRFIYFRPAYYVRMVPQFVGDFHMLYVRLSEGSIEFFVKSNRLFQALMDFFGPQYLRMESINESEEALRLLLQKS
ncbi:MAG: hypothetical protein CMN76_16105 [Spirochaetaceae bacterium]|nr:hypothetical protein [Spirochaetaceae bacterium]|tara:strand:- start:17411 stop:18019 length:609 start_codon:yes stop_codon:yes gene_type:complete